MSNRLTVTPMRYHQPGWTIDLDDALFQLWAPRPATTGSPGRDRWEAAWTTFKADEDGQIIDGTEDADYRFGDTLADAIAVLDGHEDPRFARAKALLKKAAEA